MSLPSRRAGAALVFWLLGASALGACASAPATPRRATQYSSEAQEQYERAMALFRDEDWLEAGESFRAVRREYGMSRWGWLAELRLADVDYHQQRYSDALQGYRNWIRYHPTQPEVGYARFMIAKTYFTQIPEDWFLVPASWERDQSSVHDALSALERYLRDFPEGREAPEARTLLRRTRELLARHELYVADFYASRDNYRAAVARILAMLEEYEGSGLEADALVQLGEIYLRMNRQLHARGAFTQVVQAYPRSNAVAGARRYLARLGTGPVTPVGTPEPDNEPPPAPDVQPTSIPPQ